MRFELFVARRYLRARAGNRASGITLIAIGGVFVGVAAILIVLSVINGFHRELRERILGATPHVVLTKYSYQPIQYSGPDDTLLAQIRGQPGVVSAAPFIYGKTLVRSQSGVEGVVVRGIDPQHEQEITDIGASVIEGEFGFDSAGVVIGVDLARMLGVGVGDRLSVVAPYGGTSTPLGFLPRTRSFRVNGVFDSGLYEYNSSFIYVALDQMQRFLEMPGMISGYELKVSDIYRASAIARRVEDRLGFPFRAVDWIAQNRNLFTALRLEKVVTFIVLVLIVLVAAFNIVGMLTMIVLRKTREIGILKTIGARPGAVTRIFVFAGLLMGGVGTGLGAAFGFIVSWLLNKYRFVTLPGDVYFIKNLPVEMQ
ncbi:ABC transporter permease, partial [candidate division WOR-3 bacterium]|nr:ABC transporter permease [candidate division WOR-3 bacterium]